MYDRDLCCVFGNAAKGWLGRTRRRRIIHSECPCGARSFKGSTGSLTPNGFIGHRHLRPCVLRDGSCSYRQVYLDREVFR